MMAKGWCSKHYYLLREGPRCAAHGCELPAQTRGFCRKHGARFDRNGDPFGGRASRGEPLAWLTAHMDYTGSDCLVWPFAKTGSGYGAVEVDGKYRSAHRVICEMIHGAPPERDSEAAHSCGNGHLGCVNPKHLRWATSAENHADALEHGTHSGLMHVGSAHPYAKINEDIARDIKRRLAAGEMPTAIAKSVGTTRSTVNNIKFGLAWRHVSI